MITVIPKVLTESECLKLLHDTDPINTATDNFYFKPIDNKYGLRKVKCANHELVNVILERVGIDSETVNDVSILYYPTHAYNPQHSDNSGKENGVIVKYRDWTHTAIVFLNNNFTGGELVYPDQGCVFSPTIGTFIMAPADIEYTHLVKEVLTGDRFTLVIRITK